MKRKQIIILVAVGLVIFVTVLLFVLFRPKKAVAPTVGDALINTTAQTETTTENTSESKSDPAPPPVPTYPVVLSAEQAGSLTAVVNKKHKLPPDYAPSLQAVAGGQLRPDAANALQQLLNDAAANGLGMKIISSYRSYQTQESTYNGYVAQYGQAETDTFSARPGHSEHQTGLAVDLGNNSGACDLDACFGNTPAGMWLANNAKNYGFIIRYENGRDAETGYHYEPWHLRFVGVDTANAIIASGKTLDQYFNVPAGGY